MAQTDLWDGLGNATKKFTKNPNVDFWLVGTTVIGGTEDPNVGFYFDPITLNGFELNSFYDVSE